MPGKTENRSIENMPALLQPRSLQVFPLAKTAKQALIFKWMFPYQQEERCSFVRNVVEGVPHTTRLPIPELEKNQLDSIIYPSNLTMQISVAKKVFKIFHIGLNTSNNFFHVRACIIGSLG